MRWLKFMEETGSRFRPTPSPKKRANSGEIRFKNSDVDERGGS